jgi:hypothetical protein
VAPISFWAAVGTAGLFALSATYKTFDVAPLARTLRALDVKSSLARWLAIAAPGLEMIIAALSVAAIPIVSPAALVAAAAVFAYAGVRGARSAEPIPCNCFGPRSKATLGRRQLAWSLGLVAVALLLAAAPPAVSPERWVISTSLVFLGVMVIRVIPMISVLNDLRASRIGLSEVYPA